MPAIHFLIASIFEPHNLLLEFAVIASLYIVFFFLKKGIEVAVEARPQQYLPRRAPCWVLLAPGFAAWGVLYVCVRTLGWLPA